MLLSSEIIECEVRDKEEEGRQEAGDKRETNGFNDAEAHEKDSDVADKRNMVEDDPNFCQGRRGVRRLHPILNDSCCNGGGGQNGNQEDNRLG